MKNLLTVLTVLSLLSVRAAELKVLMVGNSFSQSVLTCLPNMVKADKENKLVLAQMYIGGCTLSRHIDELQKSEKDSGYKPYTRICRTIRLSSARISRAVGVLPERIVAVMSLPVSPS